MIVMETSRDVNTTSPEPSTGLNLITSQTTGLLHQQCIPQLSPLFPLLNR